MLVMVTRVADFTRSISPELNGLRHKGSCEFCDEPVYYNRMNYEQVKGRGDKPMLCCTHCYKYGNHLRQGYRA